MDRKDFFKKACFYGICGCAAMPLMSMTNAMASSTSPTDEKPDWRIGFMQDRFAKLVDLIGENLDEKTRSKMFEEMGRECSRLGADFYKKHIGNIDGFIKEAESKWAEKIAFDKTKKEIKVIGKKQENCFCPFVNKAKTPKDFCNCSKGWQKETFGAILGKEITDAEIDESILKGGERCSFTAKIKV